MILDVSGVQRETPAGVIPAGGRWVAGQWSPVDDDGFSLWPFDTVRTTTGEVNRYRYPEFSGTLIQPGCAVFGVVSQSAMASGNGFGIYGMCVPTIEGQSGAIFWSGSEDEFGITITPTSVVVSKTTAIGSSEASADYAHHAGVAFWFIAYQTADFGIGVSVIEVGGTMIPYGEEPVGVEPFTPGALFYIGGKDAGATISARYPFVGIVKIPYGESPQALMADIIGQGISGTTFGGKQAYFGGKKVEWQ